MAAEFKVGDRVRVIKVPYTPYKYYKVGDTGTVSLLTGSSITVQFDPECNPYGSGVWKAMREWVEPIMRTALQGGGKRMLLLDDTL